jgi:hypothetical protein
MGQEWYLTIRKFYVLHYEEYDSQFGIASVVTLDNQTVN